MVGEEASMRKAIVMAGGQGSRLWPLNLSRPKPLVPIANRPVMAYILEWLRRHGVSEVLVTLHYRADHIRRAFGDGRSFGLSLTYRVEEAPLGTADSRCGKPRSTHPGGGGGAFRRRRRLRRGPGPGRRLVARGIDTVAGDAQEQLQRHQTRQIRIARRQIRPALFGFLVGAVH
jgi:Nucleotidyl transferase